MQGSLQHIKRPPHILHPETTHMRRNNHIPRPPQRVALGQRLRVRNIEHRPGQRPIIQRFHQRRLIQDLPPADIRDIWPPRRGAGVRQEGKFSRPKEVGGRGCEREGDDEEVDGLREEGVEI